MARAGAAKAAGTLYIMYVGSLPNGVILPAFNNAEIRPGQPIKVRGDDALNFEHAAAMLASGDYCWCDENGTPAPIGSEPEPTPEEAAILDASGAALPQGGRAGYPAYYNTDEAYTGPAELPEPGSQPDAPELTEVALDRPPTTLSIGGVPNSRADTVSAGVTPDSTVADRLTQTTEPGKKTPGEPDQGGDAPSK